jgi:hypothetical protein
LLSRIRHLQKFKIALTVQELDDLLGTKVRLGVFLHPIGFSFRKYPAQLIFTHRDKRFPGSHKVCAIQVIGCPTRAWRNVEDNNSSVRMLNLFDINPKTE